MKQMIKVGFANSKWSKLRRRIPQGSILDPLFINDIFMIIEQSDICNNTLHICGEKLTEI